MKKLHLIVISLALATCAWAGGWNPAVEKLPVHVSTIDTTASWYRPERIYYEQIDSSYGMGDFLNAIDLPTVFGIGFNPTGYEQGISYYSQLYLEWRPYKTYGWLALVSLTTHDQDYDFGAEGVSVLSGWTPGLGVAVGGGSHSDVNVRQGTVFNMALTLGGGYRIPLVPDIRGFYDHPYTNKLNLSLAAQFGYAWSRLNHIVPVDATQNDIKSIHYFHPVMNFSANFEYLVSPKFCIFAMGSYMQHLTTMPWDNRATHAGTVGISIGFASFFE